MVEKIENAVVIHFIHRDENNEVGIWCDINSIGGDIGRAWKSARSGRRITAGCLMGSGRVLQKSSFSIILYQE